MLERTEEGIARVMDYVQGSRVFGLPIVDSLLPDGVPVPCSVLITADPGSGGDIISTAIAKEHLSSSLSVPFREQRALWLSLDNFVDDLRNNIDYICIANQPKIQFIDCYSSQIGIDSKERFWADPSNLPYLSMVTSAAISELNEGGRLLVVLDSLTSLIQKVGVRRSIEFFRILVGKTRSISADLLTTVNRRAFTDATIASFADIADLVIELAVEEAESAGGKLRVHKARNVRHYLGWRNYEIDFELRTFQYDALLSLSSDEFKEVPVTREILHDAQNGDLTYEDKQITPRNDALNVSCAGAYCTFGGRAIAERERLVIFTETLALMGKKYQDSLLLISQGLEKQRKRGVRSDSSELLDGMSEHIGKMNGLLKSIQDNNKIHPSIRRSSVDYVIRRALTDSVIPTRVGVAREPDGSLELEMDPALVTRALSGVLEAAIHDMPHGGSLAIRDCKEGDMAVITVHSSGLGSWDNDLSSVFNPSDTWQPLAGLGLIIARKFIEAHGGMLNIRGERGKGTTFTVRLPM